MKISVINRQKVLPIKKPSVRAVVQEFLELESIPCEQMGIYFVTMKEICRLHDQFFNDPSPTDCITFPIDLDPATPDRYLGDIFIAPEAALAYPDPYEETTLYLVHGLLHLIGYDDLDPTEKKKMRRKEKSCMRRLSRIV